MLTALTLVLPLDNISISHHVSNLKFLPYSPLTIVNLPFLSHPKDSSHHSNLSVQPQVLNPSSAKAS